MQPLVNLLAWRAMRRQGRLLAWSLLFAGCGAAALPVVLIQRQLNQQHIALLNSEINRQQQQLSGLQGRLERGAQQARRLEALELAQAQQQRRQQAILAWQTRLHTLSKVIPDTLWLTALEVNDKRWQLQGHAQQLSALTAFRQGLAEMDGFPWLRTGETAQDENQRWRFSLTLYKEKESASAP